MYANSGNILIGKPEIFDISFYATRITSKIPAALITYAGYGLDNAFGNVPFLQSASSTLSLSAGKVTMALGYLLTLSQLVGLGNAIFGDPDFENSKWILY